jgi:hypothetical protein
MALTDEDIIDVPGMFSRWVRLGGGAKVHYMTSGDGKVSRKTAEWAGVSDRRPQIESLVEQPA